MCKKSSINALFCALVTITTGLSLTTLADLASWAEGIRTGGKPDATVVSGVSIVPSMIGTHVTMRGRLTQFPNGRFGIVLDKPPREQIAIDALPCPDSGELAFRLETQDQEQSIKHPKYKRRSKKLWLESDARQKRLDHLIEQYQMGESLELTGRLCHLTTSIRGNVHPHIHYPKLPESHYYFSVDDVRVTRLSVPLKAAVPPASKSAPEPF